MLKSGPSIVLVQGDTTTAFIGALAAFYQKKVCHLKNTFSEISPIAKMDMYFLPSSLCDRCAFLSEPVKISKCSSMSEETKIEVLIGVIMFNLSLAYIQQGAIQDAQDLLELASEGISKTFQLN